MASAPHSYLRWYCRHPVLGKHGHSEHYYRMQQDVDDLDEAIVEVSGVAIFHGQGDTDEGIPEHVNALFG